MLSLVPCEFDNLLDITRSHTNRKKTSHAPKMFDNNDSSSEDDEEFVPSDNDSPPKKQPPRETTALDKKNKKNPSDSKKKRNPSDLEQPEIIMDSDEERETAKYINLENPPEIKQQKQQIQQKTTNPTTNNQPQVQKPNISKPQNEMTPISHQNPQNPPKKLSKDDVEAKFNIIFEEEDDDEDFSPENEETEDEADSEEEFDAEDSKSKVVKSKIEKEAPEILEKLISDQSKPIQKIAPIAVRQEVKSPRQQKSMDVDTFWQEMNSVANPKKRSREEFEQDSQKAYDLMSTFLGSGKQIPNAKKGKELETPRKKPRLSSTPEEPKHQPVIQKEDNAKPASGISLKEQHVDKFLEEMNKEEALKKLERQKTAANMDVQSLVKNALKSIDDQDLSKKKKTQEMSMLDAVVDGHKEELTKSSVEVANLTKSGALTNNPAPQARGGGLDSFIDQLNKGKKATTLAKSKEDWEDFKTKTGEKEDLERYAKDGFLEKQAFLERSNLREFEKERDMRNVERERAAAKEASGKK